METLPPDCPLCQLYPEDTYPNGDSIFFTHLIVGAGAGADAIIVQGNYYQSPFGRTKYWLLGPESGEKV